MTKWYVSAFLCPYTVDKRFTISALLLLLPSFCLAHYMHSLTTRSEDWGALNEWPRVLPVTFPKRLLLPFFSLLLSSFVQQTCEDFLVECRFAGKSFPCFQNHNYLTWTTTTSHFGTCCSFHYHPLSENFQPFAANAFGIEGALTVVGSGYPLIADGQSGIMYSSGFLVSEAAAAARFLCVGKELILGWLLIGLDWIGECGGGHCAILNFLYPQPVSSSIVLCSLQLLFYSANWISCTWNWIIIIISPSSVAGWEGVFESNWVEVNN